MELLINLTSITTASVLIILLVKRLLRNRTSSRWQLAIWLVLIVQLVFFPFSDMMPESDFSMRNFIPVAQGEVSDFAGSDMTAEEQRPVYMPESEGAAAGSTSHITISIPAANTDDNATTVVGDGTAGDSFVPGTEASARRGFDVPQNVQNAVQIVWAAGIIVFLAVQIVTYLRYKKRLSALPICDDAETLAVLKDCKELLGIKGDIALRTGADSAMLTGLLRPEIYIHDGVDKEELRYILVHELSHYKHKDILLSVIATLILAVFWYNPVMYFAFRAFRRDLEVCCDDRAVKALGSRREYAMTLYRAAAGTRGFVPVSTAFIRNEKEIETRIKRLAGFKKPKTVFTALAVVLTAALCVVSVTGAAGTKAGGTPDTLSAVYRLNSQIDVPSEWLENMERLEMDETAYFYGGVRFNDEAGNLVAQIYDTEEMFTEEERNSFIAKPSPSVPAESLTEQRINEAIGNYIGTREEFAGAVYVQEESERITEIAKPENDNETEYGYKVYSADGYNILVRYNERSTVVTVAMAREDAATADDLLAIIQSERSFADYSNLAANPGSYADRGVNIKDGYQMNSDMYFTYIYDERMEYAKAALSKPLDAMLTADVPVEYKVKDYKITSMKEYKSKFEIPEKPDISLGGYYDEVRWDVIYPTAMLMQVSYELTPEMPQYYEGETVYKDRLALFAGNDFFRSSQYEEGAELSEPLYDYYFIGFVEYDDLSGGMDSAVLSMLDSWYYDLRSVLPQDALEVPYIGVAPKVSNLVWTLPLRLYLNPSSGMFSEVCLILHTEEEPYGLTVNYYINKDGHIDFSETPDIRNTERVQGNIYPVYSDRAEIMDSGLNAYVAEKVYENAGALFQYIGNLGELTVNVHVSDGNGTDSYTTYTFSFMAESIYDVTEVPMSDWEKYVKYWETTGL